MRSRHGAAWAFAAVLLLISALFLAHFVAGASWRVAVEPSRIPCTLRPGAVVEFFFTTPQPWLQGIGIEHLPQRRPPGIRLELYGVPDGDRVAAISLKSNGGILTGHFGPLDLAPRATLKGRLIVDAGGSSVLLNCTPVPVPGVTQERPVVYGYHAMGPRPDVSFWAWCAARVRPLLPPGAMAAAVLCLALAPLLACAAVGTMAALAREDRGA